LASGSPHVRRSGRRRSGALIFFIGIFGDEGVAGWGWAVAIALAAGAIAALVWGARIWRRRRY